MKKVLVLEDDHATLEVIEKLIHEIDKNVIVYKIMTLPEAYQIAVEHDITLFIVDIMIDNSVRNDVSGLVFVEKIRKIEKYAFVPVIFITALVDPELHAYRKLHCYGYLEKPLLVKETKQLINQALKFQVPQKEEGTVYFRKDGIIYAVDKKDIVYIKSHGGKVTVTTVRDELVIYYRNCKEVLEELDSDRFIQCNRGNIVNIDFIANIDPVNRVIQLKDNFGIIEISTMMKKSVMEKIKND